MTADTLEWTFQAASLPPALRDIYDPGPCEPGLLPARDWPDVSAGEPLPQRQDTDMVAAIGHALQEVLTGRRAVWQLARWIAPDSLEQLAAAIRVGRWTHARLRSARASRMGTDDLLGRVCLECDGHPMTGCLRLHRQNGRWHCTQFTLLLPGSQVRTTG